MKICLILPEQDPDWPSNMSAGDRRYLSALLNPGPTALATNARGVSGAVLRVGDHALPLLIADGAPGNASMLSPIGHHVLYPIHEMSRRAAPPRRWALHALGKLLETTLRLGAVDKAVFVNHWLLTAAPPPLPPATWPAVRAFLVERFPGHAIIVQDVKPSLDPSTAEGLERAGARALRARQVTVVDPRRSLTGKRFKTVRHNRNRARRLLEAWEGSRLAASAIAPQTERMAALYRARNVLGHSALNLDYTPAFFALALSCDAFRCEAWHAGEGADLAAFNLVRVDGGVATWSAFGSVAEPEPDAEGSFYELATAVDLALAENEGLRLDWGGGAAAFKVARGAEPHEQLDMVFVDHLGARRRAAWTLLARLRRPTQGTPAG
ncbi:MAG: hypothetical protein AAGE90_02795 [Pseudomonadota bacterium]